MNTLRMESEDLKAHVVSCDHRYRDIHAKLSDLSETQEILLAWVRRGVIFLMTSTVALLFDVVSNFFN